MEPRNDAAQKQAIEKAVQSIQAEKRNSGHATSSDHQIAALRSRVTELEDSVDRLHKMMSATIADLYGRIRQLETATQRLPGFLNEFRALRNDVDWIKKSAEFGQIRLPDDPEQAESDS